jgi:Family of unknown function (DUF5678)
MNDLTLVKNSEKYFGQYVAVKSFTNRDVVSHGSVPLDVVNEAKQKGFSEPVLIFVPVKGMLNIY